MPGLSLRIDQFSKDPSLPKPYLIFRVGAAATPARIALTVHARAAAVRAGRDVLVSVGAADATATTSRTTVQLSYAGFARAHGGDWASRLRLASLPTCALSTPDDPACRVPTASCSPTPIRASP